MVESKPFLIRTEELQLRDGLTRISRSRFHLIAKRIGMGAFCKVDLYKRVKKGSSSRSLCAIKSYHVHELMQSRCPIYSNNRHVMLQTGLYQVEREIRLLQELRSVDDSHIVRLEEVISHPTHLRLVLQYAGAPVMTFMESEHAYSARVMSDSGRFLFRPERPTSVRVFTEEDAAEILSQLLDALTCLRRHSMVHKDVKPENVLIDFPVCKWRDPEFPHSELRASYDHQRPIRVTLCDFNSAEQVPEGRIFDAQGTVLFSPPEVFGRIDPESGVDGFARDAWSAGMLAFCLLAGYHPIKGSTPIALQLALLRMPELHLPEWVLSSSLKRAVEALLAPDPRFRISAGDAIAILR